MELWIRTQDKLTLMKATYVYVAREEVCAYDENKCWSTIGIYKSQERALEVLDEIQGKLGNEDNDLINKLKILEKTPIINCSNNDECEININIELLKNMIIYEMPKD